MPDAATDASPRAASAGGCVFQRWCIHTHSAALCWAGCDRLAKIARSLGLDSRAEAWRSTAQDLRKRILESAWNAERNSFVASLGGTDLDASLLLMQELGIVAANDPRFISTVEAIATDLKRGRVLFRYSKEDDFDPCVTVLGPE